MQDPSGIPDILDSLDPKFLNSPFLSVSDRYYTHKYCPHLPGTTTNPIHHRISFHSNRICLISLAPFHPIMKDHMQIVKVNFSVTDKVDRSKNAASGKGKRGAQKLETDSVLCYVECEGGEVFPVYSCVKGKLVEVNEGLVENPRLLVDRPKAEGYVALVLPILCTFDDVKESMMSEEDYLRCFSS